MRFCFVVRYIWLVVIGTSLQALLPASTHAGNTNVFNVKSNLKGAGFSASGAKVIALKGKNGFILGTNGPANSLAIAVYNVDCLDKDPHPSVRLVAYNRAQNKIIAPLVEFIEYSRVLAAENKIIMQCRGVGLNGVEGANLDAVITFTHVPCTSSDGPTAPLTVSIQPLGIVKPNGTPTFQAPITGDDGTILFLTEDPNNPVLEVEVTGLGREPSPNCDIDLNTTALTFSSAAVGSTNVLTFSIRNNGSLPCTVNSVTLNGSSAFTVPLTNAFIVPPASAVNIPVSFIPITNGADSAVLRVTSTDPNDPQQFVNLSGNGTAAAPMHISAHPLSLNFSSVPVGTSLTTNVTVSNTGGETGHVDRVTLVTQSQNFSFSTPGAQFDIAPGTSQVITVTYTPTDSSTEAGTLEIDNNDPANRLILIDLNANGVIPVCQLTVETASLPFGAVALGSSQSRSVGVTNIGLVVCTINTNILSGSGDFTLSPPLAAPLDLLPGDSASFTFVYAPTSSGAASATATIGSGSPITLTGSGVAISSNCTLVVTTNSIAITSGDILDFGDVAVGSTNVQKILISNTSTNDCMIQELQLTGSFTLITPPQPIQLGSNQLVEIGIRYVPNAAGASLGQLVIITDSVTQPITDIQLRGNAVQVILQVSTNALNFGALPVLEKSPPLSVFLTNTNTVNAAISRIDLTGSDEFSLDLFVPRSAFFLAPGSSVEIPVSYRPQDQGSDTGTVSVTGNQLGSPTTFQLFGTGIRANLGVAPTNLPFGVTQLNITNTQTVTIRNTGNTPSVVNAIEILGSSRYFVIDPPVPFVVLPDDPVTVRIDYLPINIQTILILGGTVKSSGKPTIVTP